MKVAIAGGHGKIALRLTRLLVVRGSDVLGLIRNPTTPFSAPVPRDDVASVLASLVTDSRSAGQILYLSSGSTPIDEALDNLLR
ncbi:MAG TPA: hypothetical protein VGF64_16765 [Acidimicrobiales bacterium]